MIEREEWRTRLTNFKVISQLKLISKLLKFIGINFTKLLLS